MPQRRFVIALVLSLAVLCALPAVAAIFSGTVKSVASDGKTLVVETSRGGARTVRLGGKAQVTLDDDRATLDALEPGMKVTVTTDGSGQATRIRARTESAAPAEEVERPEGAASRRAARRDKTSEANAPWPQFRGPNRDGCSPETDLLDEWPSDGPELVWSARGLGEGFSSVAVAQGLVFTMGNIGNREMVLALNQKNGRPAWAVPTGGPAYRESRGNGPRCTPTIDGDKLYALGANGDLVCLVARTGKPVWSKNILREYGAENITWAISESVLIDGEKLICTPGGRDATMVAMDKGTGRTIWKAAVPGSPQAAYASAVVSDGAGVRQYVNFVHTSVVGVRAEDGKFLWQNERSANSTANCAAPLAFEDYIFSASGYGTGGALVELTSAGSAVGAELVYHTSDMKNHHGGMVLVDGHIYGCGDPLACLDARTGDLKWRDRSVGKGSVVYADGHLYVRSEEGPVALVEATPEEYREMSRFDQPQRSDKPAWAYPVVADGRLYLRDMDVLLVYDVKK